MTKPGMPEWIQILTHLRINEPTLTTLDLTLDLLGNQIGASGAKALSLALKENRTLTTLRLSSNEIRDSGAQAFSEALKENRTLIKLDLSNNEIGDSGAKELSLAL